MRLETIVKENAGLIECILYVCKFGKTNVQECLDKPLNNNLRRVIVEVGPLLVYNCNDNYLKGTNTHHNGHMGQKILN